MSPPQMSYAPWNSRASASSAASIQRREGTHPHRWAAKERFSPGARFLAINAASMGMVPEPQKGSQNGSRPL